MKIPLGTQDYRRTVAQEPAIALENRYFETDPSNQDDQVALLSRPSLKRWMTVGEGPIRGVYSQPGTFDEALFVVSASILYRIDRDETVTLIGDIGSASLETVVSFAATDDPFLFLCDGGILWVYTEDSFASGVLTASGVIVDADTIEVGGIYYRWTAADVDAGTPNGSLADPWLVALGASNAAALSNMRAAINDEGLPGSTYSNALSANTSARATSSSSTTLDVRAITQGVGGNGITTTKTGANIAWGGGTLSGGGVDGLSQVATPDDVGIISVGYIGSFVICVVAQGFGFNGRFYWIEPFEMTIEPLNFATAEKAPDPLWSVNVVGDQFWLPGSSTNEVWYLTGDEFIPFLRVQGRVFDRGVWEGTAIQVKDTVVLADRDGVVYAIGGGPERISTHAVEQEIRLAMQVQILLE